MSDQAFALLVMLLVGFLAIPVCGAAEDSKKVRIAAGVWVAVWWLPSLTMLWIKGVFG